MERVVVTCRKNDIRRIRISCRCGNIFVTEVPQQIARSLSLHPCPGCSAAFSVTQDGAGKWVINRLSTPVDDMVFSPDEETKTTQIEQEDSCIGLRVRIVDVSGRKETIGSALMVELNNPHPEHIGKYGTIIGKEDCGSGYSTPKIKLDDGTVLFGTECWWEPVAM